MQILIHRRLIEAVHAPGTIDLRRVGINSVGRDREQAAGGSGPAECPEMADVEAFDARGHDPVVIEISRIDCTIPSGRRWHDGWRLPRPPEHGLRHAAANRRREPCEYARVVPVREAAAGATHNPNAANPFRIPD